MVDNSDIEKTTLIKIFKKIIDNNNNSIALRWENNHQENLPLNKWNALYWNEYYQQCLFFSKYLLNNDFNQKETVCIYSFNCSEWLISFIGTIFSGGYACGIYPTDSFDQINYKINDSNCSVLVVENNEKITEEILSECLDNSDCPLKKIIVIDSNHKVFSNTNIVYWDDLIKASNNSIIDDKLENLHNTIQPSDTCVFVYTSGTTGNPKAVCLTHDNLIFQAETVLNLIPNCNNINEEERILSYLPLSHVAGMMVDIIFPIIGASKLYSINLNFSRSTDLKNGTIKDRMNTVRPTLFLGVPRVWEKFNEGIEKKIDSSNNIQKKLINWAIHYKNNKKSFIYKIPIISYILNLIALYIINKIKRGIGLDECKYYLSGAAPLSINIIESFQNLNIDIAEVYGMSESTGTTSLYTKNKIKKGCCGMPLPGTEIKIVNEHNKNCIVNDIDNPEENQQGEVCFRGRHIMRGYYCKESSGEKYRYIQEKNKEIIDSDGWLHSGDKGVIDNNGNLKITGRYKEIIIGAGGENIAPVPIENKLKQNCNLINQVLMIGDKQKYNIALITLKLSNYGDDIIAGNDALIMTDLVKDKLLKNSYKNPIIIDLISDKLNEINKDGNVILNNAFKIQKFCILPFNFSIEGGEFTATLKIKRSFINEKYKDLISKIYINKEKYYIY